LKSESTVLIALFLRGLNHKSKTKQCKTHQHFSKSGAFQREKITLNHFFNLKLKKINLMKSDQNNFDQI